MTKHNSPPVISPDPKIWGPVAWRLFHSVAAIPKVEVSELRRMLIAVSTILPCAMCSIHLQHLLSQPVPEKYTKSGKTYMLWMHNQVNEQLGRPQLDDHEPYPTPYRAPKKFADDHEYFIKSIRETHNNSEYVRSQSNEYDSVVSNIIKKYK